MTRGSIVRFLNPRSRRDELRQQVEALRRRDGETCRRCRRPLRFDLPSEHGLAPTVQPIGPAAIGRETSLDELCLCHGRCNADAGDATAVVQERVRLRA